MELILIRHALPIRRELLEGIADPELSDTGRIQAMHLAEYLAGETIDAIYASPLRRATQTAEPLAARHQLPIIVVDGVAEYDRTSNEYVPIEELKASNDPRWQQLVDDTWAERDETRAEFGGRVLAAIDGIIDAHPSETVAVVCHGGVINSYLGGVLGLAESPGFFYPDYTSVHRVMASRGGGRSILALNETAHLRGTDLPIGLYGKRA